MSTGPEKSGGAKSRRYTAGQSAMPDRGSELRLFSRSGWYRIEIGGVRPQCIYQMWGESAREIYESVEWVDAWEKVRAKILWVEGYECKPSANGSFDTVSKRACSESR